MNYLAHLALSPDDAAIMTGNFIADDIPFKELADLPEEIKSGINLHRVIDKTTDAHPSFKKAVEALRPHHRKYAPVVLDILHDHLLSIHWSVFYDIAEETFHDKAYEYLESQVDRLPPRAGLHVKTLLEYRYLRAYGSRAGLKNVLVRIDKRTRFQSDFASSEKHLYDQIDFFTSCFLDLYKDVKEMSSQMIF